MALTVTEEIVSNLCSKTFLSLWAYGNPIRRDNNKELCDVLVIFGDCAIIFSVKEIKVKPSGDPETDANRWFKKAIVKSAKQIDGAKRALINGIQIQDQNGREIPYSKLSKIFRIGVAFGRGKSFHLEQGEITSNGFTHVLDEKVVSLLLKELDTFSDLIEYLEKKEEFIAESRVFLTGEEDLLAYYILNNRGFPIENDLTIFEEDIWNEFIENKQYIAKREQDKASYHWDKIIEEFATSYKANELIGDATRIQTETALRTMATENRFLRRVLAKAFLEAMGFNNPQKRSARLIPTHSGVTYVFLPKSIERNDQELREERYQELMLRCFVARHLFQANKTVVGITMDPPGSLGHSLDLVHIYFEDWTSELKDKAEEIKKDLGYFDNPVYSRFSEDEYPE